MRNLLDLGGLALADEGARVGRLELLRDGIRDLGAGGLGEGFELGERFLGGNFIAGPEFDSDQDRAFDVFERLTASTAQMKTSAFHWTSNQPSKNAPNARRRRSQLTQLHGAGREDLFDGGDEGLGRCHPKSIAKQQNCFATSFHIEEEIGH